MELNDNDVTSDLCGGIRFNDSNLHREAPLRYTLLQPGMKVWNDNKHRYNKHLVLYIFKFFRVVLTNCFI